MFNLGKLKKKDEGEKTTLNITGMHCVSCAMNIDMSLEELPGVTRASTDYARAKSEVVYDPKIVSPKEMIKAIAELGYTATV